MTFERDEDEEADETDDEVAAVPFRLETTLGTVELADTEPPVVNTGQNDDMPPVGSAL